MGGIMLERSSIVKQDDKTRYSNDSWRPHRSRRSIRQRIKGEKAMTVCVAAIGNNGQSVFGASDQMITAGDIQFEPAQQKIWKLSPHIALMVAGDVGLHSMFYADLWHAVDGRLAARHR